MKDTAAIKFLRHINQVYVAYVHLCKKSTRLFVRHAHGRICISFKKNFLCPSVSIWVSKLGLI